MHMPNAPPTLGLFVNDIALLDQATTLHTKTGMPVRGASPLEAI
jgi:hypothetical protein